MSIQFDVSFGGGSCRSRHNNTSEIKVTKREIIFSSLILLAYIVTCSILTVHFKQKEIGINDVYAKAVVVENEEMFNHCINTNKGLGFSYADIDEESIIPASVSELNRDYLYVYRNVEDYTKHTRTTTDKNGNKTTTTYYSWDTNYILSQSFTGESLNLNGFTVKISDISLPAALTVHDIDSKISGQVLGTSDYKTEGSYVKIKTGLLSYDRRVSYRAVSLSDLYEKDNTSFMCVFENHSIAPYDKGVANGKYIFRKSSASEMRDNTKDDKYKAYTIGTWIGGFVLTAGLIIGFVCIDNKWLEEK